MSASVVRQTGNLVVLETEDGQQFRIYANELTAEDQAYLRTAPDRTCLHFLVEKVTG